VRYDRSSEEWNAVEVSNNLSSRKRSWIDLNTVDAWRHIRMLEPLRRLGEEGDQWLTIGDGRYGSDARILKKWGKRVCASDFWPELLQKSDEYGLELEWKKLNAEEISEADETYDFVLAKECLHHLPRPYLGLYEILRVAKKAAVIIEPHDTRNIIKEAVKVCLGRAVSLDGYWFEPVGNFGYSFRVRELEKLQLGLGCRCIAYRYLADYYDERLEYIQVTGGAVREKCISLGFRAWISLLDFLTRRRLIKPRLVAAILFKKVPEKKEVKKLRTSGWKVKVLPKNPYI